MWIKETCHLVLLHHKYTIHINHLTTLSTHEVFSTLHPWRTPIPILMKCLLCHLQLFIGLYEARILHATLHTVRSLLHFCPRRFKRFSATFELNFLVGIQMQLEKRTVASNDPNEKGPNWLPIMCLKTPFY